MTRTAALAAVAALASGACGGPAPPQVDVEAAVRREAFRATVTASGEIVATRYADIGSNAMGRIVALPVAEGDRVEAGQILARLDAVQAASEVEAAEAQLRALEADERAAAEQLRAAESELEGLVAKAREAETRLERLEMLRESGLVPASEFDSARAAFEAAAAAAASGRAAVERVRQNRDAAARRVAQGRAAVVRARDALAKTSVVSPMAGVVTRLLVREGEMVVVGLQNQPGTTLMTVSDLSGMNAEVKVAEADVLRVAVGQPAEVTLQALPGRVFNGRVTEIGASALPTVGPAAAREFKVVVALADADGTLRPGMTCDVEIVTAERRGVVTVPLQSVVTRPADNGRDQQAGVFVPRDGRVQFVPVTTGIIGGLEIEVGGIEPGTPVVAGPYQVLRTLADGAPVRTRP